MRKLLRHPSQVTTPAVLGLIVSWFALVAVIYIASRAIDAGSLERDLNLARSTTRLVGKALSERAKDYAFWNDAVRHLALNPDATWAERNIGAYLHESFGVTSAFVVGPTGDTIMAFESGEHSDATAATLFGGGLVDLIAESEAASADGSVPAYGLFSARGRLYILAASVIMQEKAGDGLDIPRPGPALVLGKALDESLMAEYAEILQLPGLRIVPSTESDASCPLLGRDGAVLGYLTWDFEPAGILLLASVAVPIAIAMVFTAMFLVQFWRRTLDVFHAQSELSAASMAKDRFMSSMSHELRTPLNAILGFSELIDSPENPLNEDQRRAIRHIREGGDHLLHLVNQVLDLSQIETGKFQIVLRPVDCRLLIDQCVSLVEPLCARHGVTFVDRSAGIDLPRILAHPTRGRQVLLNLLSNAVKFNRPGGSVMLEVAPTDRGTLRFSVTDTGPGIPQEKFASLFTPFSRLDSDGDAVEGTGIGLVISRALVLEMKGDIGFTSTVGEGSTFWFELAVDPADEDVPVNSVPDTDAAPISLSQPTTPKSILYIEDNLANAAVMKRIFQGSPNIAVSVVETAETGLEQASRNPPDLILMDINLPGMSGIEACRRLKEHVATADIPVLAVTADVMNHDARWATEAGFVDFVYKPFRVADIRAIVSRILTS